MAGLEQRFPHLWRYHRGLCGESTEGPTIFNHDEGCTEERKTRKNILAATSMCKYLVDVFPPDYILTLSDARLLPNSAATVQNCRLALGYPQ